MVRKNGTDYEVRGSESGLIYQNNPKFELILGKYLHKAITCRNCGYVINTYEEKETDVRIATQIVADVCFLIQ